MPGRRGNISSGRDISTPLFRVSPPKRTHPYKLPPPGETGATRPDFTADTSSVQINNTPYLLYVLCATEEWNLLVLPRINDTGSCNLGRSLLSNNYNMHEAFRCKNYIILNTVNFYLRLFSCKKKKKRGSKRQ